MPQSLNLPLQHYKLVGFYFAWVFWLFWGAFFFRSYCLGVYCNWFVLFWMVEENIHITVMQHKWWALALRTSWLCHSRQDVGSGCVTGGWWQRWARTDIRSLVALLMAQNQLCAPEKWAFSQDRQMQLSGKLRVRSCAVADKEQTLGRQLTYIHSWRGRADPLGVTANLPAQGECCSNGLCLLKCQTKLEQLRGDRLCSCCHTLKANEINT